ncbi:MAG: hypothetical protein QME96_17345, partial [Myxococcota bacterium]|nr:hypothetical protein [Myxococcota bacterium]
MIRPLRVGVDAGSTTWKAVAIDGEGRIVAAMLLRSEPRVEEQSERALAEMLGPLVPEAPPRVAATG